MAASDTGTSSVFIALQCSDVSGIFSALCIENQPDTSSLFPSGGPGSAVSGIEAGASCSSCSGFLLIEIVVNVSDLGFSGLSGTAATSCLIFSGNGSGLSTSCFLTASDALDFAVGGWEDPTNDLLFPPAHDLDRPLSYGGKIIVGP